MSQYGGQYQSQGFGGNAMRSNNNHAGTNDMGSRLQPVDFAKQEAPASKWVVFNSGTIKKHDISDIVDKKDPTAPKAVTEDTLAEWYKDGEIVVLGEKCPLPMTTFDCISNMVPVSILKSFERQGFSAPTKIQALAWPILMQNRDMVGIAKTGSGKTLAFMIPAIVHIEAQPTLQRGDGPMVCVLAPTRELAQQIEEETRKVMPPHIRAACIYGGAPKGPQINMLWQGVHVLIGTPGRLIDMLEIRKTNLLRVTYLVLDEADRMLDMGFEPQVRSICGQIRKERQTLMFSATWPKEIQNMAAQFQRDFIRIHVGSMELAANTDVTQHFVFCDEYSKFGEVRAIMQKHCQNTRTIIFAKMKRTTDDLERQLRAIGINAMALHGDKEQRQREWILAKLKRDPTACVIATDVAARGLDVKELDVVINYDFPMQVDDYVHRIGRTGRAGAKGQAFTLMTKKETQITPFIIRKLVGIVSKAGQMVPEELTAWGAEHGKRGAAGRKNGRNTGGARGAAPARGGGGFGGGGGYGGGGGGGYGGGGGGGGYGGQQQQGGYGGGGGYGGQQQAVYGGGQQGGYGGQQQQQAPAAPAPSFNAAPTQQPRQPMAGKSSRIVFGDDSGESDHKKFRSE